jgi:hypothetical protein
MDMTTLWIVMAVIAIAFGAWFLFRLINRKPPGGPK